MGASSPSHTCKGRTLPVAKPPSAKIFRHDSDLSEEEFQYEGRILPVSLGLFKNIP